MSKKFERRVEDFVCVQCGVAVRGTGYTNHCPRCLWSRHVDVYPGDRSAACGSMMEPIGVAVERDGYTITHRCVTCGVTRRNRSAADDSTEALLAIARTAASQ
jgi:hypothetical protein